MNHRGQRALREGEWKYLRVDGHDYLFNIARDARERVEVVDRAGVGAAGNADQQPRPQSGRAVERDLALQRVGGFRVARQPRRDVVVLLVGQPARQRGREGRQQQPEHEDDPLEPAVADSGRECPAHDGALGRR